MTADVSESVPPSAAPVADPRARRRRRLKLAGIATLAVVVAASPLWAPLAMAQLEFFRLRKVDLEGVRYLNQDDVLKALAVDTTMSVWDPTGPMVERLEAHPGIRRAVVRRTLSRLPGTLLVEIEERVPVALVPTPEGFRAFDERGLVLPYDPITAPVDAPILAQRDTALLRLLAEVRERLPALYTRTSEVSRRGGGELLLRLVSVPVRTMADVTIERLAEIAPVEADLARRQLRVSEIDLRYRDQVIVRQQ